jgi:hypothetical protein
VTSHPIPENTGAWWLGSGKERRLHAIPGPAVSREQMRDGIDEDLPVRARAACGMRRSWWMPGLFSRLGRRRCTPCCHALGIPAGYGTPANENARKDQPS